MESEESVDVLIIGAGFAGIGMAVALKRSGRRDFVLLEAADAVGGTWRENRYPGCACDVPSVLYSFSFAQNPNWSRHFAPRPEILAYLQGVFEAEGLGPHTRLGQAVTTAAWSSEEGRWKVQTRTGARWSARVLIAGVGGLSRPGFADLPGLSQFRGRQLHTANWDPALPLAGARVGVIGTGGSAIQLVPQIAGTVAHLALFQRTPPWILPRRDAPVPAWRQRAYARLPALQRLSRAWTYGLLESRAVAFTRFPHFLQLASRWARAHLEAQVSDVALRAALMPDYTMGCKRILLSDDYYPSLQLPQVTLHTTRIERVEPEGVRLTDGRFIPLDILVHGTGFQTQRPVPPGLLSGLDGRDLAETWGGEAQAYLGTTVHGFPNLFLLVGPNTGLGHSSMVYMIESQVAYVKSALEVMDTLGIGACHPRKEVQDAWNVELQRRSAGTVWMTGGCRSWYLSPNGHNTTLWPGFTFGFRYATRRFDPRVVEIL